MSASPAKLVQSLLSNPEDLAHVRGLTTSDVTYVSLNERNPDLQAILPWTGTHKGPESKHIAGLPVEHGPDRIHGHAVSRFGVDKAAASCECPRILGKKCGILDRLEQKSPGPSERKKVKAHIRGTHGPTTPVG